jgi:CheY-like chemotaxis protein/anti-sigma regulatory factor (Ser/Thr protein kinase)
LNAIYRSAQHLLDLTDDVLDLAQADVNRLALVRDRADLAEIVREAGAIVGDYIRAKGLELKVAIDSELPLLHLDSLRIRQVILNLLTNAARFTDRGQISIAVTREEGQVQVVVSDTGRGISADKLERMFEEFHHVDQIAAREHVSTGLGLAISKKFVELHHGRMGIESQVGLGTKFRITLPIEDAGEDPGEVTASIRDRPTTLASLATTQRPLVLADGRPSLRRLFQRRLDSYRVVSAVEPEQAGALAEELKAAAIVADVTTPIAPVSTPIIRCSLRPEHAVAKALGVADYFVKPVTRTELRAAIDRLCVPIKRILLVDDDARAVRLLTRMLGTDYDLLSAHNGDEALELLQLERPELVILDLAMPGRSGHCVLEAIRAEPELSNLPIVIVSASAPEPAALPTSSELTLSSNEGISSSEVLDVIEAILGVLTLPRSYLPPTTATREGDRAEIVA